MPILLFCRSIEGLISYLFQLKWWFENFWSCFITWVFRRYSLIPLFGGCAGWNRECLCFLVLLGILGRTYNWYCRWWSRGIAKWGNVLDALYIFIFKVFGNLKWQSIRCSFWLLNDILGYILLLLWRTVNIFNVLGDLRRIIWWRPFWWGPTKWLCKLY